MYEILAVPRPTPLLDIVKILSLTIASVADNEFTVAVIPHTIELTNWNNSKAGDLVNLEIDIMSKYVESLMSNK